MNLFSWLLFSVGLLTVSKKAGTNDKTLVQEPNKDTLDTAENCSSFTSPVLEQRTSGLLVFEGTSQVQDEHANFRKVSYRAVNTAQSVQRKHCSPSHVKAIPCHITITKYNKQKTKFLDMDSLWFLLQRHTTNNDDHFSRLNSYPICLHGNKR